MRPGVTTPTWTGWPRATIRECGAVPSFKGYRGRRPPFPGTICTSLNEQVVHGIPGRRSPTGGDLLTLDVGAIWEGYHWTRPSRACSSTSPPNDAEWPSAGGGHGAGARRRDRPAPAGARLSDVGHAVQQVVEGAGFSVVREYVGHGIGRALHEDPQVPNYGDPGRGPVCPRGWSWRSSPW